MTTSFINAWTNKGGVWTSTRASGKLEIRRVADAEYVAFAREATKIDPRYYLSKSQDFPGWIKYTFTDYEARKHALEVYTRSLFEADVPPNKRYIADHDVKLEAPRWCGLDIETDSDYDPRTMVESAPGRILSWSTVDPEDNKILDILQEDRDEDEARLLGHYWDTVSEYDLVAAWNGDGFDFPVIEMRSDRLARLFPQLMQSYWANKRRILLLDYMELFKRHHMAPESGDDKTSMKLDAVCTALLGYGKTDFEARKTRQAWDAGGESRLKLGEYNLQDTALIVALEAAVGYLALQQTIGEVTNTPVSSHGVRPMAFVDGYLLRRARELKTHLPSKIPPTGLEKPYEGAYVMEPTKLGIHRTVHVCDFKSLYPSVIRSLNISPDTKDDLGATAFGTGVMFGSDAEGMVPLMCRDFMEKRSFYKKKAKANPNDKDAERKDKAYKIANNSVYGVMGAVYSRFYDREVAESVTLGAKAFILATIEHFRTKGWEILYGDTDSVFVTGCTVEEFLAEVKWLNANLYPKMLTEHGANLAFNCIELDYEKCFDRLVFPLGNAGSPSAKRYLGSYLHYAFGKRDKPEIRGLEYMRGDGIRLARRSQKEAIDKILAGATKEEMLEWVLGLRQRIMTQKIELEDIQISKGLGRDLDDYKVEPGHVKLARELIEQGEDIGQGSRIAYVIVDGTVSPAKIVAAQNYDGTFDRHHVWMEQVWPCLQRVLAGAYLFPWNRFKGKRPSKVLPGQLTLTQ